VAFENKKLLGSISSVAITQSSEWHPRDLANTVWAWARLVVLDRPLLDAISEASLAKIDRMNQQDLSNTAWAYAQLEMQEVPLIYAIADRVLPMLGERLVPETARDLALLAWSLARLGLANGPLFDVIAAQSLKHIAAGTSSSQALSNTAWAFATSSLPHEPLFEAIAKNALATLTEFGQQELANTAWAFAEIRIRNQPLIEAISTLAFSSIDGPIADAEEAARGGYALAWAQDRHGRQDLARSLVSLFAVGRRCHSLAWGLIILDEEWRKDAPPDGALAALEAMAASGGFSSR